MRINREYGQRSETNSIEPKNKYFIACEGKKTEYKYFSGITKFRNELGINPLIEIVPIEHEKNTSSNPYYLYEDAKKTLGEYDNYFPDKGDCFCIIVDRDKHSFTEEQYDALLQKEEEKEVQLYVSNPCFEFWLLLHFSDCKQYNGDELLENHKVTPKRSFAVSLLQKTLNGSYSKQKLGFEKNYKDNVKTAIKNAQLYSVDVRELKNNLGTNVGVLIESFFK